MSELIQENCGIAGVIAPKGKDASLIAAKIAYEQQHRGQQESGMATKSISGRFHVATSSNRFGAEFTSAKKIKRLGLRGEIALGHTRYGTTGPGGDVDYAQPMHIECSFGAIAAGFNGNIANAEELHEDLKSKDVKLKTEGKIDPKTNLLLPVSDAEILFTTFAHAPGASWQEKIARGMEKVEGSVSAVIATDQDEMIALKDPWAIRPGSIGRLNGHWLVASESTPLDKLGAYDQQDIKKGEMWTFRQNKDPEPWTYDDTKQMKLCDFEDWYFSWPSSRRFGAEAQIIREMAGEELARDELLLGRKVNADVFIAVPDTGRSGAITCAEFLGIPYRDRIFKERYDDKGNRSFIQSNQLLTINVLEDKFLISRSLEGQIAYIGDDSGIRLKTVEILNKYLKEVVKVKETHWRFFSPRFKRPCFLGTNISSREELGVLHQDDGYWYEKTDEEIANKMNADSIAFLSMDARRRVRQRFGENPDNFCGYCHGEPGPDMNWLKYDPEQKNERYQIKLPVLTIS